MDISKNGKIIISIIGAIGMVFMAAIFFEDRYENESDAAETKSEVADIKQVSQEQIDTLQSIQQQNKASERTNNLISLEALRNLKILLKNQLDEDPNNAGLEDRIERIQDLIDKLENRLYQ